MASKIIYFLIGVSVATAFSFHYFSKIIKEQNVFIENDFKHNIGTFKGAFSEQALPLMNINLSTINQIMDNQPAEENIKVAHTLLASTVLLNEMTIQDEKTKEYVFLTTLLFYSKSTDEAKLLTYMPLFKEECERNLALSDCSEKMITELLATMKK